MTVMAWSAHTAGTPMQGRFVQSGRSAEGRQAGNCPGLPVKEADKGI